MEMKGSVSGCTAAERLGLVGILVSDASLARERVAELLAEFGRIFLAATELQCEDRGVTVTCVAIKATTNDLGAFTGKLGLICGVRVKSLLW